jgi:hypothetical protein
VYIMSVYVIRCGVYIITNMMIQCAPSPLYLGLGLSVCQSVSASMPVSVSVSVSVSLSFLACWTICGCSAEVLTCVGGVCVYVWGGAVRGGARSAAFSPHPEQDNRWCQLRR